MGCREGKNLRRAPSQGACILLSRDMHVRKKDVFMLSSVSLKRIRKHSLFSKSHTSCIAKGHLLKTSYKGTYPQTDKTSIYKPYRQETQKDPSRTEIGFYSSLLCI